MNDYATVVEDLRSFLQSSDQVVTEQISAHAARYAQLCTDVNQRLRRCEEFLRKGLRAEAIQFAKTEPPLLEIFSALDFPERDHLEEVTTAYDLTVPPRLNVETARTLQQAIAEAEPLADLLRQHRLLALARAPLVERLRVLRRLNEGDPANPLWPECVQTFEKARLRKLEAESEEAIRKLDTAALTRLHAEVTVNRWLAKPPPALVKRLTETVQKCLRAGARQDLVKIAKELQDAYNLGDADACRRHRDQWNQLSPQAGLPANDPLHQQVAPALEWLEGLAALAAADQAFAADVNALHAALNGVLTRPKLEELAHAVQRHGREFPADLAARCSDRRDQMVRAEKMRKILIIGGVAAAVLVLAAGSFVLYRQGSQAQIASRDAAYIRSKSQDGQLQESREFADKLASQYPDRYKQPEVQQACRELEVSEAEEKERLEKFEAALAEGRVEDAAALARNAAEDKRVASMRKELAQRGESQRQESIKAFREKLAPVRADVEKAEKEPEAADGLFRTLLTKLGDLGREAKKLGAELQTEIDGLTMRVKAAETNLSQSRRRDQLEKKLDNSVPLGESRLEDYIASLKEYVDTFAEGTRSSDFRKAIEEQKRWEPLLAWWRLLKEVGDKPLVTEPGVAKSRAESFSKFLEANADFVEAEAARQYQAYVEAVAQREEANQESGAAAIKRAFNPNLFSTAWIFDYDSKTYYSKEQVRKKVDEAKEDVVSIKYMIDFESGERPKRFFLQTPGGATLDKKTVARAPQALLAEAWSASEDKPWEVRVMDLVEKVRSEKRLDPIGKYNLLKHVLQGGVRGSPGLRQALSKHLTLLEEVSFDVDAIWINPEADLTQTRVKAVAWLGAFPDTKSAVVQADKHAKDLEKRLMRSRCIPVGWLARDRKGAWECRSGNRPLALSGGDHELCVLSDGESASWLTIGQLTGGKPRLHSDSSRAFVEGRLIFARPSVQP